MGALEDRTLPSTFTVLNLNDGGPGSLRAGIASGDDTIVFARGLHGTIKLTSGELLIATGVTIKGPGANQLSVSGNNASRVFEMAAGLNVTVSGLTITHGYAPDLGGGILNDGSNLTLSGDDLTQNVVFESATNGGRGGGLRSLAGSLTITDCQITDNQALGGAGASAFGDALGGGLYVLAGSATISNSTISGNLARGGDNSGDGGAGGGGIFTDVPTSITSSALNDNVARAGDNTPDSFTLGGGLYVESSSTTIMDSEFSGNAAVGGNGGIGPFIGEGSGGGVASFGFLSVSRSTFDANLALGGSGGNSGPGAPDPFVDYSFGGAILNEFGGTMTVTASSFSHNQAIGGNDSTAIGTDIIGVGGAEGGAIYNEVGAAAAFTGCNFDHNQAQGGNGNTGSGPVVLVGEGLGGAIVSGYGGPNAFSGPDTLTVSDSTLTQNIAVGGDNNSGTGTVAGLIGVGAGAGMANYAGGTASISDSVLSGNQARGGHGNTAGGTGAVFAGLGAGGGIFNFLGNYNSSGFGPLGASSVTVTDTTLDHNQAQGGGGGNGEGGGLADLLSATTTVSGSAITHNEAIGDGGGAGLGGGAYNDATSSLTLDDASVTQNHANGSPGIGGGIYDLGTFSFDALTVIEHNHASTSGDNIGP
jgi:hypothetical protein